MLCEFNGEKVLELAEDVHFHALRLRFVSCYYSLPQMLI